MAILIEATTVVIAIAALERRFPGGAAAFAAQCTNDTYRSDGKIAAVSFMVLDDAKLLVDALSKYGFSDPGSSRSEDIAVVVQGEGLLAPCGWLKVDLRPITCSDGATAGATVAWTGDEEPSTIAVHDGWRPHAYTQVSVADLNQNYDVVEVRTHDDGGAVTSYRHRLTGRLLHVGRPAPPGSIELTKRYRVLSEELGRLMTMPESTQRTAAAAELYKRATELVADSEPAPGVYTLQGVAARLANDWHGAESAFRTITERWPDTLNAWFELTWALSALGPSR